MIESSDETAPTHNNENTAADTNGKRDEKILSFFQPTTTSLSEKRLAQTLGYPATWHVVRTVSTKNNVQAFCDRIYAGPPSSNPDTYYNHGAAMAAALRWIEGKSTPHDNEGGQMNPRVALFEKDEYVEVLYEPDEMWYGATIMKCVMYQDDIRYTVLYIADGATQTNVAEELIRKAEKPKPKKRKKSITPSKDAVASSKKKPKKEKSKASAQEEEDGDEHEKEQKKSEKEQKKSKTVNTITSYLSPSNDKLKIHRGRSAPKSSGSDGTSEITLDGDVKGELPMQKTHPIGEEGGHDSEDPPWRTTNHKYLHRQIRYPQQLATGETIYQIGTVVGYIAKTDKDSEGNPGFISEITGSPAALFHVVFGAEYEPTTGGVSPSKVTLLQSQDLEEYELQDCLMDGRKRKKQQRKPKKEKPKKEKPKKEEEEEEEDEDNVPLSSILGKKDKYSSKKRGRPKKKD